MRVLEESNYSIKKQKGEVFIFSSNKPLKLELGGEISQWELAFECFGNLNKERDNVILVHHALSSDSHVASTEKSPEKGWWEAAVGSGKAIDTDKYFVICINNLGSCFGSSGPASINPITKQPYRFDFPRITIFDMVRTQRMLLKCLGVQHLYAVIGNSMGGMLSLAYSIMFSDQVQRFVSISSCARSNPVSIAHHQLQREIIVSDPNWCSGYYKKNPYHSLMLARKFAFMNYKHPNELNSRFKKTGKLMDYLNYQAKRFACNFDVNCYLYLLDAMDSFDLINNIKRSIESLKKSYMNSLIISVSSDLLFPPSQQHELYQALLNANAKVKYVAHNSKFGHDAFYVDEDIINHIGLFLSSNIFVSQTTSS